MQWPPPAPRMFLILFAIQLWCDSGVISSFEPRQKHWYVINHIHVRVEYEKTTAFRDGVCWWCARDVGSSRNNVIEQEQEISWKQRCVLSIFSQSLECPTHYNRFMASEMFQLWSRGFHCQNAVKYTHELEQLVYCCYKRWKRLWI